MTYDIIPDLHGDIGRAHKTLEALGWLKGDGLETAPRAPSEKHKLALLGDFIDGGLNNRKVLDLIWHLIDQNQAIAVMGNHELNAIHYHRKTSEGEWMREHTIRNSAQHQSFIEEIGLATPEALERTKRFLELPLWLDVGEFRIVHACWDDDAFNTIATRRPDARLKEEDLEEVAEDKSDFALAVNQTLKGPKSALPNGARFCDHAGHLRSKARVKWWAGTARKWRDAVVSVPNHDDVPDVEIRATDGIPRYHPDEKPVFFGHYKFAPGDVTESENSLCLDYPEQPVAYRHITNRSSKIDTSRGLINVGH